MAKCELLLVPSAPGAEKPVCYCRTHSYRMWLVTSVDFRNFECPIGVIEKKVDEVLSCRS